MTPGRIFQIESGGVAAALAPSLGGALLSLGDRAGPMLRAGSAEDVAADPRKAACFACAPWFGRLGLSFEALGRKGTLRPALPDASPLALHGDGWISAWTVTAHTDDQLLCRLPAVDPPSGFPFAYEASQEFRVGEDGLQISLSIRNIDKRPMPAGLGLHPYFRRARSTRVAFDATGFWTPPAGDAQGRFEAPPSGLGAGVPAALPGETLDHSFTGFGGAAIVTDEWGAVRVSSSAPILHVYAPAGEEFFCLEPVSHLPGAFPADAQILAPGERARLVLFIGRPA